MSDATQSRLPWLYEGIWGLLSGVFCVPRDAPTLPSDDASSIVTRKPSPEFVKYLKLQFWLVLGIVATVSIISGTVAVVASQNGWVALLVVFAIAIVMLIGLIGYLAIHLRYDTTWYIFSDRSMRLRRGIWLIRESTITFENVQNVKVTQGPLERYFGIANVVVETAGGGGASPESGAGLIMHSGLIEGVAEAAQIRDLIMSHVRTKSSAGLGDEHHHLDGNGRWSTQHLEVLREIRDLAQRASRSV